MHPGILLLLSIIYRHESLWESIGVPLLNYIKMQETTCSFQSTVTSYHIKYSTNNSYKQFLQQHSKALQWVADFILMCNISDQFQTKPQGLLKHLDSPCLETINCVQAYCVKAKSWCFMSCSTARVILG